MESPSSQGAQLTQRSTERTSKFLQSQSSTRETKRRTLVNTNFLYNGRIALALIPPFVVVFSLGGQLILGAIVLGMLVSWIFELLKFQEGTFLSLWVTLVAIEVKVMISGVVLVRHSIFYVFLLFMMAVLILLTGMWVTLHFAWLNEAAPIITLVVERALFACIMIPCSAICTWATIALYGIDNAAFYYLSFLLAYYLLFGFPTQSSYKPKVYDKSNVVLLEESYICTKVDNGLQVISMIVLPSLLHIAVYHKVLFTNWVHIFNLLILICVPILIVCLLHKRKSLWWLGLQPDEEERIRTIGIVGSVMILTACLEHNVIFTSFYRSIALFPPWSYLLVTTALYSLVGLILAHFYGLIGDLGKKTVLGVCIGGAVAGSLVLGIPFYLLWAPLLSAYCMASFYFRRKLRDFVLFVFGLTLCLVWYMKKTLWFLDYEFREVQVSVQNVTVWITLLFVLSFAIPGVIVMNKWVFMNGLLLLLQSASIAFLEQLLFQEGEQIYPFYLIAFTSMVGAYLSYSLEKEKRITKGVEWILIAIYLSKLSLILSPVEYPILSSLALILTTAPLYLYESNRMSMERGLFHCVSIGVAAFMTKGYVPAKVYLLSTMQEPSYVILLGLWLIMWGVGCIPLSYKYFAHVPTWKKLNLLVLTTGTLILIIQPQSSLSMAPRWPLWMLLSGIVITIAAAVSVIPFTHSAAARALTAMGIGMSIGLYVSGTYLPSDAPALLHLMFAVIFELVSIMLIFTQWPTALLIKRVPWLFALFCALFPVIYSLEGQLLLGRRGRVMFASARALLLGTYCTLFIAIAVLLKFKLVSLSKGPSIKRGVGEYVKRGRENLEMEWLPYVGNISTVLGFILAVIVNMWYLEGSPLSIFFLAPILLLLNRDKHLFSGLNRDNRYFPVVAAVSIFLAVSSLYSLILKSILIQIGAVTPTMHDLQPTTFYLFKNLALFAATLPSHLYFNSFVKNFAYQGTFLWLTIGPVNVLTLIFGDIFSLQLMAIVGLVAGVIEYIVSSRIQSAGKEIL